MSWNQHNHTIDMLDSAAQHRNKSLKAKLGDINTGATAPNNTAEKPSQLRPNGNQQQAKPHNEEAKGGIARGRDNAQSSKLAIAALNTKAATVSPFDLLGCPIGEFNHNICQPFSPPFTAPTAR